jgi:hypothetical protein
MTRPEKVFESDTDQAPSLSRGKGIAFSLDTNGRRSYCQDAALEPWITVVSALTGEPDELTEGNGGMVKRTVGATVCALVLGAATSAGASPTTTPPGGQVPAPPPTQQPTMQACDNLYNQSPLGSAYETYGDTCAGRRPAGTLPYCTEVFTDTVVQQASPTTTSPSTTSVASSTTVAGPLVPPTDPDLASRIPGVEGYSIAEMPVDDVLWKLFDDSLPGELTRHHALVVGGAGAPVAHLVVAGAAGDRSAIDTFVEHTFADEVFLPAGSAETGDGTFTTLNSASPIWTEMEGSAVIVAEQEIDGNFQWAWTADDAVWIVRGKGDAEAYVRALLQLHAPTLDAYDQQGLTGDLFDHTPSTPGYTYFDFPRDITLDSLGGRGFGDCAERFYLGYILPDGVTVEVVDNNLLWLGLEKAAGRCVDNGLLDDVAADIAAGRRAEQIGGLTVYRDDQITTALIGDVLITLYTTNPQTYVDLTSFIEQFFAGQPR